MITFGHVSIPYLLEKNYIKKNYYEKSFKFCFVRNPWDRTVSIYHYLKFNEKMSFKEFVFFLQKKFKLRSSLRGKIFNFTYKCPYVTYRIIKCLANIFNLVIPTPPVDKFSARDLSQANPQTDWILDRNNNLMVDFVGKVENIEKDLEKCLNIVGIKTDEIPHTNKTKHKNYRNYYNQKTKKIIGDLYKKDIELFGYKF